MKIAANTNELARGLTTVSRVLKAGTFLPITENILCEADGDTLTLIATDLDTTITTTVPVEVAEPGTAAIEGKTLAQVAKALPADRTVSLNAAAGKPAVIECGASRFKLDTLDPTDFPARHEAEGETLRIDADTLTGMAERAAGCASDERSRPILNGVLFESRADGVGMVATNGHRLCRARTESDPVGEPANAIVPPTVLKFASHLAGEIEITISTSRITIADDATRITGRNIDGTFPNWRAVVPKDNDKTAVIATRELRDAVRRISIVALKIESNLYPRATLTFSDGGLDITADAHGRTAREELRLTSWDSPDTDKFRIGFNVEYLDGILKHVPTDELRITFKAPERTAMVHPVGDHDFADLWWLLMPLRVV